jgi:chemotaxis regulatin CheY-phosphate phosphatase CheZ
MHEELAKLREALTDDCSSNFRRIEDALDALAQERDELREMLKKWNERFEYEADNKHVEALVNETAAILAKYRTP